MTRINTSSDVGAFDLQAAQTACAVGFAADLLDGPVWLEGFAEATGRTSTDDPLIPVYDPVTIARTNPDLGAYDFVSQTQTDDSVDAAERFDAALGLHGTIDERDARHSVLHLEDPDDFVAAVLAVLA